MTAATLRPVDPARAWPLFDVAATRRIEQLALELAPPHSLMQRAGRASARLALAVAPHAQTLWVAAGPGNNGGDGLEAAAHLQRSGKQTLVTWLGKLEHASSDTAASWQRAVDAGVEFADTPPERFDLCLDALLGIGAGRPPASRMAEWVVHMNTAAVPILAIDVPTGLNADTGHCAGPHVRAHTTLSLLTLKPGLFTAHGRDAAGRVWLDDLQVDAASAPFAALATPCASYGGCPEPRARLHASHKGSFGDVAVVGGGPGMVGAAVLAASAALHFGAGRVYLAALDPALTGAALAQPELMLREAGQLALADLAVVCGCGGGDAVRAHLPRVLSGAARLVLDADALNAVALDTQLQRLLRGRAARGWRTVLTPHPLEAARLLGTDSQSVQQDRLAAARQLAEAWRCTVVLKGSGTVLAAPGRMARINPTGNARLATAGTGDVLAGAIGAALAAGLPEHEAAWQAVYLHGLCADAWPSGETLTASLLARRMHTGGA
jgi:hydroxyethylthiazole kinase-like uncharacterized protein yjeF